MVSEAEWPCCSSLCPSYSHNIAYASWTQDCWSQGTGVAFSHQSHCFRVCSASCVISGKFLNLSELISLLHIMVIIMGILFEWDQDFRYLAGLFISEGSLGDQACPL